MLLRRCIRFIILTTGITSYVRSYIRLVRFDFIKFDVLRIFSINEQTMRNTGNFDDKNKNTSIKTPNLTTFKLNDNMIRYRFICKLHYLGYCEFMGFDATFIY